MDVEGLDETSPVARCMASGIVEMESKTKIGTSIWPRLAFGMAQSIRVVRFINRRSGYGKNMVECCDVAYLL
jgi:hypothetical protein